MSSGAHAQQPLGEFIRSSSDHALDARRARAALQQANAAVELARARLLPSVQASAQYARNQYQVQFDNFLMPGGEPITIQAYDQASANLAVNVPLIDIAGWAGYFQNEAAASAVEAQTEVALENVHVAVVQLWHQVVAARALVEAARQSLAVAETARTNVGARVEVGMSSELDFSRATAEVERSRQVLAEAELQATLAANNLANLTGLAPSDQAATLEDDGREEGPLERFFAHIDDLPMVRAADRQASASSAGQTAAWLGFLPVVSGQLNERATNASGFAPDTQWTLTLNATWMLDYGRVANVMVQDAIATGADVELDRAEQQARTAIFEAWHRVRTAIVQRNAAVAAEAASERALRNATARFEAGTSSQIEQIQAQRDRFGAQVARIQATANLRVARAALRLRSGTGVD
jgi:outer membrane protein